VGLFTGEGFSWQYEGGFSRWLESHKHELPVPLETIQELLKERTWQ
jgi:hypothetical protein